MGHTVHRVVAATIAVCKYAPSGVRAVLVLTHSSTRRPLGFVNEGAAALRTAKCGLDRCRERRIHRPKQPEGFVQDASIAPDQDVLR